MSGLTTGKVGRLFAAAIAVQPPEQGDPGQSGGETAQLVPADGADGGVADPEEVEGEVLQPVPRR